MKRKTAAFAPRLPTNLLPPLLITGESTAAELPLSLRVEKLMQYANQQDGWRS